MAARFVTDPIQDRAAVLDAHRRVASALGRPLDRPDLYVAGKQLDLPLTGAAVITERPILTLRGLDSEAMGLHVIATSELVAPVPADFVNDAALLLLFGCGGAQHRVEIDLGGRGAHAVVPGSGVDVVVRASGSGTLRVRCTAAYSGSRPPWAPIRTRVQTTVLAPAAVATLVVPDLAAAVRIQRTPSTQAYGWAFRRQNAVLISSGFVLPGQGEELVRVPPDAVDLRVTNFGLANIASVRAIFEVLL